MLHLGLIGSPLGHSLSPWLHENFMEQTGVEGQYKLMELDPEQFDAEINQLKGEDIDGFNITVPFKRKIIPYLDSIEEKARKLGAVNTVVVTNGKWRGYNTDGAGYLESVNSIYPDVPSSSSRVLIIGSGGAARGVAFALSELSLTIDVANRTSQKAIELLEDLPESSRGESVSLNEASEQLEIYDWVIQTTSVGMSPNDGEIPIEIRNVKQGALFSDIVYKPLKTQFLIRAEEQGARIHYGHLMLLYQAAYAFELWTGEKLAPQELIRGMESKLER
ncbi:shikimate dehydrogenase [Salimicrobium halophilum]|uniref:Shikimate dehydrogenase (NADP(+)) n=1 Tax=Salimicrobium halophilum TaxID=86666 RepID=A0A1G8PQ91_9BACI|nr:shikimate dehydrogenase [Salimicrobium halophilum]SDI94040.1 shikimate dehydrogenase [Salimicrobium halophilum]